MTYLPFSDGDKLSQYDEECSEVETYRQKQVQKPVTQAYLTAKM